MAVDNDVQSYRTDDHRDIGLLYCDLESTGHVLRRSHEVLKLVSTIAKAPYIAPADGTLNLHSADSALRAAEHLVVRRLTEQDNTLAGTLGTQLTAVLTQLGSVRLSIRDVELAGRSAAIAGVHKALQRLRSVSSAGELAGRVPIEISRLGYNRAMFSRLCGAQWIASSAFVRGDVQLADAMVRVGNATPGRLDRERPETDLVRRRTPILVHDAQGNPHVHHELKTLMKTQDYVAAPLIARGDVVGVLHADENTETGTMGGFDRDVLGLFAEGLGLAFERIVLREQLTSLRNQLEDHARSVSDLLDGFIDSDVFTAALPAETSHTAGALTPHAVPLYPLEGPLADLTRRELEVLRHLADGESNTQIAANLFIAAGTVKTHVKNLLRKLGAANRAEAVSRYHGLITRNPHR
jgi:DNA-binding CsgD family transcriptional regulator/GAF domain-containing protein